MDKAKRNKNLGLACLITGYLTLMFWLLAILLSVEIGVGWESYTVLGFFAILLAASGVFFILSLIFNIIESKESSYITKGLMFTIIGFPPVAFCCLAIVAKALTEGH